MGKTETPNKDDMVVDTIAVLYDLVMDENTSATARVNAARALLKEAERPENGDRVKLAREAQMEFLKPPEHHTEVAERIEEAQAQVEDEE